MNLTVEFDDKEIRAWRGRGVDEATVKATRYAGTDAFRRVKARAAKVLRERKAFKVQTVQKGMRVKTPGLSADIDDLEWELGFSGKPVPVIAFPARQVRSGVSVLINKGKRTIIRSAFIATTESGHRAVWKRVGQSRLPIRELLTSRISDVAKDADVLPELAQVATTTFSASFARVMKAELDKLGGE